MAAPSGFGLYRSRRHRFVAGVAGGLAERFGLAVLLVRLIWVILLLPGGLPGFLPYVLLWVLLPLEPERSRFDRF
jgi:phage shock protein PspC (stress-responsive transcriptional regulator)